MATVLHSESKRLYSWWWDSHIPKNSKWLQENLADIDNKVKAMIKLIEEDADSFARRAEMYYKKRPELMKLVEEFYKTYRALAERYDHAIVELRHVHKTMAEAFPDQVPFDMSDGSSTASSEPRAPKKTQLKVQPFFVLEDGNKSKRGFREVNELFGYPDARKADTEVEALKKSLAELQAEKEALHFQYQQSLNMLSRLEKDLENAQKDVKGHDDHATKAEIEIKTLKEALEKLESERDASLLQYNQSMERISDLEALITQAQEETRGLTNRASKAESEAQHLKQELSTLHAVKEARLLRYKQCLEMISSLENKIRDAEESAQMFKMRSERAENEVGALKEEYSKLNHEKEDVSLRYQQCLETLRKLEAEISHARDNAKRLTTEVLEGAAKLKTVEDQCALLESSNQTLRVEADNLMQKLAVKDQELFEKQNNLEKLQTLLQDEHSQFAELEASLQSLKILHSQSQEQLKVITLELQSRLQMLRDLETCNHDLENDVSKVKEENQNLNELKNSSAVSLQIQQYEICRLKDMKEKLEEEVVRQVYESNILQEEIHHLEEEIESLNRRYQMLMEQVKVAGLDPECIASSVKKLKDENSMLIELCNNQRDEKDVLTGKLREMDKTIMKNTVLENSLIESNTKLEGSRERARDLQERCKSLCGEKSELIAERVNLLSQMKIMTESMQKLLEKNASLENSLSGANTELEGLRAKSKRFEEFFQMLKDEKSVLLKERESLVSQLNRVEESLGFLEKKFLTLEGKYADLEKERRFADSQVEELRISLATEKQERATYEQSTETRLMDLQNNVNFLREECQSRKKEFEEQLDRAVKAQVEIFILQKFIEDLEQKNFSLLIERQKYVEASQLSEKLISELESENLEQQMEVEFLLDEIENLRSGIYQVFKALQLEADYKLTDCKIAREWIPISRILGEIDDLKYSVSNVEEEKQRLIIENLVLLSLLEQFQSDGLELESEKSVLEKDMEIIIRQHEMLSKDKHELSEMNRQLKSELIEREHQEQVLRAELHTEHLKLEHLQEAYLVLQEEFSDTLYENKTLLQKFSELKGEMCLLEEENDAIIREAVALSSMSVVYKSFGSERAEEVEDFAENMSSLQKINIGLKHKVETLEEKLKVKEAQGQELHKKLEKLQEDLSQANELNALLEHQVSAKDGILRKKAIELLEAEHMLKATNSTNAELCEAVEELKKEHGESRQKRENLEKQLSELSDLTVRQGEEIRRLNNLNENLEFEVESLHKEIQEQQVREEYLSLELQEKSSDFGLYDAEATSFYFDLQISAVCEVLLENKVHELTGLCENLKDENVVKDTELKQMKETVGFLECEVGELKIQLSAYDPIVASLEEDVKSLEQSALSLTELSAPADQHREGTQHEDCPQAMVSQEPKGFSSNGMARLQEMKTRIKAIEQAVVEERDKLAMHRRSTNGQYRSRECRKAEERIELACKVTGENRPPRSAKPRTSESKNGLLMKDIPLDQVSETPFYARSRGTSRGRSNDNMLELWEESAEQDSTIKSPINCSNSKKPVNTHERCKNLNPLLESQIEKEVGVVDKLELSRNIEDKAKIMDRLVSDSRRISILQTSVRDLKNKMETNDKQGRSSDPAYLKVRKHLKEIEEAIFQLVNMNETLSKEIAETGDARDIYRKVVLEKSRNGSEKIKQLQIDMQNIERTVMKLEEAAEIRGRRKFSENRTVILLKDILHHKSGKRTARKKKSRFCGCMRSSTKEE